MIYNTSRCTMGTECEWELWVRAIGANAVHPAVGLVGRDRRGSALVPLSSQAFVHSTSEGP